MPAAVQVIGACKEDELRHRPAFRCLLAMDGVNATALLLLLAHAFRQLAQDVNCAGASHRPRPVTIAEFGRHRDLRQAHAASVKHVATVTPESHASRPHTRVNRATSQHGLAISCCKALLRSLPAKQRTFPVWALCTFVHMNTKSVCQPLRLPICNISEFNGVHLAFNGVHLASVNAGSIRDQGWQHDATLGGHKGSASVRCLGRL